MKTNLCSLLLMVFAVGCASKPPLKVFEELKAVPANQVQTYNKIDFAKLAKPTTLEKRVSYFLEQTDPVVQTAPGKRSYFKVFKVQAGSSDVFFEVHCPPYKPAGIATQFGMMDPEVIFFDEKGEKLAPQPELVSKQFASTFVDGEYLRAVWKIKGSSPRTVYAVFTAQTDKVGKLSHEVANYGAVSVGVIYNESVQFGPTGYFFVFPTATFKK